MSIIIATPETTGVEVIMSPRCEDFSDEELFRVSQGIANEDMVPVTVESLRTSYQGMGAFVVNDNGNKELVGFARQVKRNILEIGKEPIAIVEVGSVWVDTNYRGRGIGRELVRCTTTVMKAVGFLSVAVCNEDSRRTFEAEGYEAIAEMQNGVGRDRVVELYKATLPIGIDRLTRAEAINHLSKIERFGSVQLFM